MFSYARGSREIESLFTALGVHGSGLNEEQLQYFKFRYFERDRRKCAWPTLTPQRGASC